MSLRQLIPSIIIALVMLLSMANKNGRAASQGKGNTGAPGDETSSGQPKTCMNCHNQGPIVASLAITVLDTGNQVVSQYHPGGQYTARIMITASGTALQAYGFQMIALRDAGNTDLDGFSDINPNNYKIATIANGRTYAEHDNSSASNTFNVKWTAPQAGTGTVTFYAAGNGVNSNGTTSGDGAGFNSLKLTEFGTVAASEPFSTDFPLNVSPNPMTDVAMLDIGAFPADKFTISVFDAGARLVWETEVQHPGGNSIAIPASDWQPGVYFVRLVGAGKQASVKAVKL